VAWDESKVAQRPSNENPELLEYPARSDGSTLFDRSAQRIAGSRVALQRGALCKGSRDSVGSAEDNERNKFNVAFFPA
jgi:hypothetical protein